MYFEPALTASPRDWRRMIREALADIENVLDICSSRPVRAKLFSNTYVHKLRAATSQIHDAIGLIGGVHAGVSLEMQREARDAKHELKDTVETLSQFRDKIGDEIRIALRESLGSNSLLPSLIGKMENEGLVASSREAIDQLRQLQAEADELRTLKAFAEQELIDAVCRLSLQGIHDDDIQQIAAQVAEARKLPKTDKKKKPGVTHCKPGVSIPSEFTCPLTLDLMEDPVMLFTESGGTFERRALEQYLKLHPTRDPLTGLDHAMPLSFAPNRSLKDAIAKWCQGEVLKEKGEFPNSVPPSTVAGKPTNTKRRLAVGMESELCRGSSTERDGSTTSSPQTDELDDTQSFRGSVMRVSVSQDECCGDAEAYSQSKETQSSGFVEALPSSEEQKTPTSFGLKSAAALALLRPNMTGALIQGQPLDNHNVDVTRQSAPARTDELHVASAKTSHKRSKSSDIDHVLGAAVSVLSNSLLAPSPDEKEKRFLQISKQGGRLASPHTITHPPMREDTSRKPRRLVTSVDNTVQEKTHASPQTSSKSASVAVPKLVHMLRTHGPEEKSAATDLLDFMLNDASTAHEELIRADGITALCGVVENGRSDEAKACVAKILQICSLNDDATKTAIALAGGIYPLTQLVAHGVTEATRGAAAGALANLAPIEENQCAITTSGGIAHLVGLLGSASPVSEAASMAAAALRNLACHGTWNLSEIVRCGGILPLCELLDEGSIASVESSAVILKQLTGLPSHQARAEIARALGVHTFFGGTPSKSKVDASIEKRRRNCTHSCHRRSLGRK